MRASLAGLTLIAGLLAACAEPPSQIPQLPVPEDDDEDPGVDPNASAGEKLFLEKVFPELDLTCGPCHALGQKVGDKTAPKWLDPDPSTAYDQLTSYVSELYGPLLAHPDNSELDSHGEHDGPGLQPGPKAIVVEWLEQEVEDRPELFAPEDETNPEPTGPSADEALDAFSACMTKADWDKGVPFGPNNTLFYPYQLAYQQTTGWGPCRGCHNTGWAGAFIEDNADLMFEQTKKRPYLLKWAVAKLDATGNFEDILPAGRLEAKGAEPCEEGTDPALCHPKYSLDPGIKQSAEVFFEDSYTRWKTGQCNGETLGEGGGGGGGGGEP